MERIIADTNILLRSVEPSHESHFTAVNALVILTADYGEICVFPQNLVEFWNAATRPLANNGLGWDATAVEKEINRIESLFTILQDSEFIHQEWKTIVSEKSVVGKQVHDARIAATMKVHGVSKILTFNVKDFARFDSVEVIDPNILLSTDN